MGDNDEAEYKARALRRIRSATAVVTATVEYQAGRLPMDAWHSQLAEELKRHDDPQELMSSVAEMAAGYLKLLAIGAKKTPNELLATGALAVELGQEDL